MITLKVVEIHIVSHCNLNCKSCDHFSPLAKKWEISIEEFENTLNKLSYLCKIERLVLIGGEPLLHTNLIKLVELSYQYFPKSRIVIFTNALLLKKQKMNFYQILKKYNVLIQITKYPIKFDYDSVIKIVTAIGIEVSVENDYVDKDNWMQYNLYWKENDDNEHKHCYPRDHLECIQVIDGKLFGCHLGAYSKYYNSYFGDNILNVESEDYFDLNGSMEELDKYIKNFVKYGTQFCSYCQPITKNTWEVSKRKKEEW